MGYKMLMIIVFAILISAVTSVPSPEKCNRDTCFNAGCICSIDKISRHSGIKIPPDSLCVSLGCPVSQTNDDYVQFCDTNSALKNCCLVTQNTVANFYKDCNKLVSDNFKNGNLDPKNIRLAGQTFTSLAIAVTGGTFKPDDYQHQALTFVSGGRNNTFFPFPMLCDVGKPPISVPLNLLRVYECLTDGSIKMDIDYTEYDLSFHSVPAIRIKRVAKECSTSYGFHKRFSERTYRVDPHDCIPYADNVKDFCVNDNLEKFFRSTAYTFYDKHPKGVHTVTRKVIKESQQYSKCSSVIMNQTLSDKNNTDPDYNCVYAWLGHRVRTTYSCLFKSGTYSSPPVGFSDSVSDIAPASLTNPYSGISLVDGNIMLVWDQKKIKINHDNALKSSFEKKVRLHGCKLSKVKLVYYIFCPDSGTLYDFKQDDLSVRTYGKRKYIIATLPGFIEIIIDMKYQKYFDYAKIRSKRDIVAFGSLLRPQSRYTRSALTSNKANHLHVHKMSTIMSVPLGTLNYDGLIKSLKHFHISNDGSRTVIRTRRAITNDQYLRLIEKIRLAQQSRAYIANNVENIDKQLCQVYKHVNFNTDILQVTQPTHYFRKKFKTHYLYAEVDGLILNIWPCDHVHTSTFLPKSIYISNIFITFKIEDDGFSFNGFMDPKTHIISTNPVPKSVRNVKSLTIGIGDRCVSFPYGMTPVNINCPLSNKTFSLNSISYSHHDESQIDLTHLSVLKKLVYQRKNRQEIDDYVNPSQSDSTANFLADTVDRQGSTSDSYKFHPIKSGDDSFDISSVTNFLENAPGALAGFLKSFAGGGLFDQFGMGKSIKRNLIILFVVISVIVVIVLICGAKHSRELISMTPEGAAANAAMEMGNHHHNHNYESDNSDNEGRDHDQGNDDD